MLLSQAPGHPTGRGCLDPSDECPGKFTRSPTPLNDAVDNTPMDHGFVKLYGGTIIQRKHDWLIVSAIGGGSWAMAGMTAPNASGPYSHPKLLLWPQSAVFHPAPTEPYPAFRCGDFVYAPFTSVATNRGYQILYRAPLERATDPSAWEVVQTGSLYHWEGGEEGAIWGQTFSAHVDTASDVMMIMYPSLSAAEIGAINLAHRQWSQPFRRGCAPPARLLRGSVSVSFHSTTRSRAALKTKTVLANCPVPDMCLRHAARLTPRFVCCLLLFLFLFWCC